MKKGEALRPRPFRASTRILSAPQLCTLALTVVECTRLPLVPVIIRV